MRSRPRILDPSHEFVVVGLGERGREREDLRILVQLRLPPSRDGREGRRRVDDRHRGLNADGKRFRAVGAQAALWTQLLADRFQVRNGLIEIGSRIRVRPVPADRREDPEEMAECAARRESRRDVEYRKVALPREICQPPTGGDRDPAASELDSLGRRGQGFFRVAGIRQRHEDVLGPRIRREAIISDDLDRDLRTVRDPRREHVAGDRRSAHPDQENALSLVDRETGRASPGRRGDLVRERCDDVPHSTRIELRDGPRLQHRGPHGTTQNKTSVTPSENQ